MPDLDQVIDRHGPRPVERTTEMHAAVVSSDPATTDGLVMVKVPEFSNELEYGPCPWSPKIAGGDRYAIPTPGDPCIVAIPEEEDPWVVEWWYSEP